MANESEIQTIEEISSHLKSLNPLFEGLRVHDSESLFTEGFSQAFVYVEQWNVTELYLIGCGLTCFPGPASKFEHLRVIDLSENLLSACPLEVTEFSELEELNLRCNQITTLSIDFSKMRSLKKLVLGKNRIESIPDSMVEAFCLQELFLDGPVGFALFSQKS